VADLQAQLSQAKQQIQTLQQIQTHVSHPPSQGFIQDKQTIEVKTQIRNVVKFVVKDDKAMMITKMCYNHYVQKITETTLSEQEFVYYYFSYSIMNELNKLRMYESGRAYFEGFKNIPMDMETPDVDLLEMCLKCISAHSIQKRKRTC